MIVALLSWLAHAEPVAVSVTRSGNAYVLRTPGIEARVPPIADLSLPTDPELLAALLAALARYKELEDTLTYGKTADALRERSRAAGYYGSEQHQIYAYIAAARSDFRIPPAYFLSLEPFGGTAGSGPKWLPGGKIGGLLATIALAHDPDWVYGRYFAAGPLSALAESDEGEPVYLALVGLVRPEKARLWAVAATRNPLYRGPNRDERRALGSAGLYLGERGAERFFLSESNPAQMSIRFAEDFVRAHNRGRLRSRTPIPLRSVRFPEVVLQTSE